MLKEACEIIISHLAAIASCGSARAPTALVVACVLDWRWMTTGPHSATDDSSLFPVCSRVALASEDMVFPGLSCWGPNLELSDDDLSLAADVGVEGPTD